MRISSTENIPNIEWKYARYCPTRRTEGYATLRYAPREPRWDKLMDTRTDLSYEDIRQKIPKN